MEQVAPRVSGNNTAIDNVEIIPLGAGQEVGRSPTTNGMSRDSAPKPLATPGSH